MCLSDIFNRPTIGISVVLLPCKSSRCTIRAKGVAPSSKPANLVAFIKGVAPSSKPANLVAFIVSI